MKGDLPVIILTLGLVGVVGYLVYSTMQAKGSSSGDDIEHPNRHKIPEEETARPCYGDNCLKEVKVWG